MMDNSLNSSRSASRKPMRRIPYLRLDVILFIDIILLLVFGGLMVYSAGWDYSLRWFGSSTHVIKRQILFIVLGIVTLLVGMHIDFSLYAKFSPGLLLLVILLLVIAIIKGGVMTPEARSLLGNSVQPSELAKIVLILYFATWLHNKRDKLDDPKYWGIPIAIVLFLLLGLLYLQHDLSAVVTVALIGGMMLFLSGIEFRHILVIAAVSVIFGIGMLWSDETGRGRLLPFLSSVNEENYTTTLVDEHVSWARGAIRRGGLMGVGIGDGSTKLEGLPFPHTDSIYAVIVEETGLLGGVFVLSGYLILLWRGLYIARHAPDGIGSLMAMGITVWLVLEAMVNIGGVMGLIPFPGNALPFISYGGSITLISCFSVSVLLNISRQAIEKKAEEERRLSNAVAGLRWRDRRRRVSRARRASVPKPSSGE